MVEEVVADALAGWLEKKVGAIAPALQENGRSSYG